LPRPQNLPAERQQGFAIPVFSRMAESGSRTASPRVGAAPDEIERSAERRYQLSCKIVRTEDAFYALEAQWSELCKRSHITVFAQSFDSCAAAWRDIARPQGFELCILVGGHAGRLRLILPLVVGRKGLIRVLYPLGSMAADYFDAIVEDGQAATAWLHEAWDTIRRERVADVVDLWFVRPDSVLARAFDLEKMAQNSTLPAAHLDLTKWPDAAAYRASRSSGLRRNLRRYREKLTRQGSFEFCVAKTESEVDELTDWLIRQKTASLVNKGIGDTWFREEGYRRFLKESSRAAFSAGKLYLPYLTMDGETIAAINCFFEGRLMEAQTISYDPRWAKFSAGTIMYDEAIAGAFELGMTSIDFRMGTEDHKSNWCDEQASVARYRMPLGTAGVVSHKLREATNTWGYLFRKATAWTSSLIPSSKTG